MRMVSEVMTRNVQHVSPQETIRRAAQMMDELNVGALPVCDGERLVGMVTDRDIVVRATSAGVSPDEASVDQVMSTDVRWCFEDQPLDEVMKQMADTQIRRVPVVSHDEGHRLVGIVSLGDLATKAADGAHGGKVEHVVEKVSSPSEPDRSPQSGMNGAAASADEVRVSDTGTSTGLAGSDVESDRMNQDTGTKPMIDPSGPWHAAQDERNDTRAAGGAGSSDAGRGAKPGQDGGVIVRHVQSSGGDTTTGETGAPAGVDTGDPAGASGGTAGTAGSPGTGVGAKP